MNLAVEDIRAIVAPHIFARGQSYHAEGRVQIKVITPEFVEAEVSGTSPYHVEIWLENDYKYTECTCPFNGICKHIVATVLEAIDWRRIDLVADADIKSGWQNYLSRIRPEKENVTAYDRLWHLVFVLRTSQKGWSIEPQKRLAKKDGGMGVPRGLATTDFNNPNLRRSRHDNLVLSYLDKSYRNGSQNAYYDPRPVQYRFVDGADAGVIFDMLQDSRLYLSDGEKRTGLQVGENSGRIEFRMLGEGDVLRLQPFLLLDDSEHILDHTFTLLTVNPVWILRESSIISIAGDHNAESLIPFLRKNYKVTVPRKDMPSFLNSLGAQSELLQHFRVPEGIGTETIGEITEQRLYLEEFGDCIKVDLRFGYGPVEVLARDTRPAVWSSNEDGSTFIKIQRDQKREAEAVALLQRTSVKTAKAGVITTRSNQTLEWLIDEIPQLVSNGFAVYGEESLSRFRVNRASASISVSTKSNIDWFDLQMEIDVGGVMLSLSEIKKALKKNSKYVRLVDGSVSKMPREWLDRFRHVINLGEERQDGVRLSSFHVTLIDELFAAAHQKNMDTVFEERLEQLKDFDGIAEYDLPANLSADLRNYQKAGYHWLHFLRNYRFGGCLADDMGLGKTVQALSILQWQVENEIDLPSLIITPTSVVFNWQAEIERFAPGLRVLNQTGADRLRTGINYSDYDIVLTSYGTLRRDILFLKDVMFDYVILDESQNIKNPLSQTAKAVKVLQARHRLALTGTPIENNTIELWSLFSFLNPGLLGSLSYFKNEFAKPIEAEQDEAAAQLLKKMVFPFLLRRTKEKVAPELPPKIESIVYAEMAPQHEKVYNKWRDYYRAQVLNQIADSGLNKSRMNVLEGLVKLRLLACHPHLVEDSFKGPVQKFDLLNQYLEELLAEGHKVLVFSQFVKMLTIVRKQLDAQGTPYEYLDGSTRNRKECVERFQKDEACRIFLVSLKAGGTGLNLTSADYVIHYDPWWNPAVEAQATDRSHRIGQDKHVFVYKMISKGTVEEKILHLQEKKKELVSSIITSSAGLFKQLTLRDIEELFS